MALYRVLIEGSGFEMPYEDTSGPSVHGFVVVRLSRASTEAQAIADAQSRVIADWATGKFKDLGIRPQLRIAEVERVSLLGRLRASETGYIFHPDAG